MDSEFFGLGYAVACQLGVAGYARGGGDGGLVFSCSGVHDPLFVSLRASRGDGRYQLDRKPCRVT